MLGLLVIASLSVDSAREPLFGAALAARLQIIQGFSLPLAATAGAERLLGPLDLRGGVSLGAGSGSTASFGILADMLYPLPLESLKLDLGGGLGLETGGGTEFDLRGIAGLKFPVNTSFFLHTERITGFAGGSGVGLGIVVAPRVYFR